VSRTHHQRARRNGADKCSCGRHYPCRILNWYGDIADAHHAARIEWRERGRLEPDVDEI
jgi:hypothetical protein